MQRQAVSPLAISLVILGVLALSAFLYFRFVRGLPEAPEVPPPAVPPAAGVEEAPPPAETPLPELPELGASDELVRTLAGGLSEHPRLAEWLVPDDLVRRFVASVNNVARGESPRPHLGFLEPERGFVAAESGGALRIDRRSYARFDLAAEVFASLDTAAGVRLYRHFEPLFDEAQRELGYPGEDFDQVLARAVDHILAAPIPTGPVELERRATSYHLRDPALEALTPAQKHFLRMGPDNMRQVHAKLRLMRGALGLPEGE